VQTEFIGFFSFLFTWLFICHKWKKNCCCFRHQKWWSHIQGFVFV